MKGALAGDLIHLLTLGQAHFLVTIWADVCFTHSGKSLEEETPGLCLPGQLLSAASEQGKTSTRADGYHLSC